MEDNNAATGSTDTRSLADKHKDIEFSNTYRVEYIKHLMSIAAGLFAFTVVFAKDFLGKAAAGTAAKPILLIGWGALLLSLVAGIMHMRFWASYYISWAKAFHDPGGLTWRASVDTGRKVTELIQIVSFIIGLACLFFFAAVNMYT